MEVHSASSVDLNIIQRLPPELQLDLFDLLGYIDAIRLSRVNKYFNSIVVPGTWPKAIKDADLHDAERWPVHNRMYHDNRFNKHHDKEVIVISDGCACLSCYKIFDKSAFFRNQTERRGAKGSNSHLHTGHKRFCINCGLKERRYRPESFLKIVTDQSWILGIGEESIWPVVGTTSLVVCPLCLKASESAILSRAKFCTRCEDFRANREQLPMKQVMFEWRGVVECKGCDGVSEIRMTDKPICCAKCGERICVECCQQVPCNCVSRRLESVNGT